MCMSCGCGTPDEEMDPTSIDLADLQAAADNAGISIQQVAANIVSAVANLGKSTRDDSTAGLLLKSDDEKRVALFVAYPVNKADTAVAADGHIDFAPKAVVEKAAWDWMAKGAKLGLWHKVSTSDFETVESAPHHGPDWVVKAEDGTERCVVDGDWLIAVRGKTPAAWQMIKEGLIGGVSPQGGARRRVPTADALAQLRS